MSTSFGFGHPFRNRVGFCALFALFAAELRSQDPVRPNIIVVMADDLDAGSLERMHDLGLMPHFDRIFQEKGIRFTNAFVTNSLCCPSRATFLTGQYSHNHGVLSNFPPLGGVARFDDRSTLATWLGDAGYRTGHVGKYLNGYGLADMDRDGDLDGEDRAYVPPGWDDWQALVDLSTYRVYDYVINDNGSLVHYGTSESDYQTDVLAIRAAQFIADADATDDDAPFFLAVMPLAPHVEILPKTSFDDYRDPWRWTIRPAPRHQSSVAALPPRTPSFNEPDVSDKPAWLQSWPLLNSLDYLFLVRQYRNRLESLRAVDDLLGRIFEELELEQELERTVLIFTSDNGFLYGEHRLPEKQYAFEESIRVPLFVYLPHHSGNRAIEALVLNNDLAPTVVELAGASPGLSMDGRSILPLLSEPAPPGWRQRFLVEHWGSSDSVLDVPTYAAVRSGANLLYVEYDDPAQTPELYDLVQDPFELRSLHDDPSAERRTQQETLRRWLQELRDCTGASCRSLEFD